MRRFLRRRSALVRFPVSSGRCSAQSQAGATPGPISTASSIEAVQTSAGRRDAVSPDSLVHFSKQLLPVFNSVSRCRDRQTATLISRVLAFIEVLRRFALGSESFFVRIDEIPV